MKKQAKYACQDLSPRQSLYDKTENEKKNYFRVRPKGWCCY